jgi:hypothetical protein
VTVEAEVQENFPESTEVMYTGGSVVRHSRSSWDFTVRVEGKTEMEDMVLLP